MTSINRRLLLQGFLCLILVFFVGLLVAIVSDECKAEGGTLEYKTGRLQCVLDDKP